MKYLKEILQKIFNIFKFLVILKLLDPDPESASLMRIRIRIQGGHLNADPCGSGSETLKRTIGYVRESQIETLGAEKIFVKNLTRLLIQICLRPLSSQFPDPYQQHFLIP